MLPHCVETVRAPSNSTCNSFIHKLCSLAVNHLVSTCTKPSANNVYNQSAMTSNSKTTIIFSRSIYETSSLCKYLAVSLPANENGLFPISGLLGSIGLANNPSSLSSSSVIMGPRDWNVGPALDNALSDAIPVESCRATIEGGGTWTATLRGTVVCSG